MTRTVNPPNLSTRTIDQFLGMVRDRSGTEQNDREFRTLLNVDNVLLEALRPRLGTAKYGGSTDASGSKVQGGFTYRDPTNVEIPVKIAGGQLRSYVSSAWGDVGSAVFSDVTTWLAQLNTRKTGAAADATGTVTSADSSSLTDGAAAFAIGAHVGKVVVVGGETKVITSNNATQIFVAERFDTVPTGTYNIYPRQQEFFVATGSQYYKCDGTTLTQLDNSSFALAFTGICTHDNRQWGWKKNRLYWGDISNGGHFSRNAWKDLAGDLQVAADFGDVLAVYERKRVYVKFGSNPDQFFWKTALVGYGTVAPKSVATHPGGIQLFLDETLGVMMLSLGDLEPNDNQVEPVSASQNFMNTLILAHTPAELADAAGICDGTNYYLRIGSTVYVLHVTASLLARKSLGVNAWLWSYRTYPSAQVPNTMFYFGTALCFGGSTNGQVYEVNKDGTYTDDGTAIAMQIQKCDWNPTNTQSDKSYDSLHVIQDVGGTGTVNYTFAPGGTSFSGTPDESVNLATTGYTRNQEIKLPSNPSDARGKIDTGKSISFQIDASISALMADIEFLELHYLTGVIS